MALKDQDDLQQQLKLLRAEKELLEKHVFVLNECLSVEELKIKIADIEKKKEMLISLEKLIEKLHKEIEPLTFLKSILNKKLTDENQTNVKEQGSFIDLNSNTPKVNMDFLQISEVNTSLPLQSLQTINNMTKTGSSSTQKINYDELIMTNQTQNSTKSHSVSPVNDEYMQLLDQYDVVTVQEVLNFSEDVSMKKQIEFLNYKLTFYIFRDNLQKFLVQNKNPLHLLQTILILKYKMNKQLKEVHMLILKEKLSN